LIPDGLVQIPIFKKDAWIPMKPFIDDEGHKVGAADGDVQVSIVSVSSPTVITQVNVTIWKIRL
jgi:hypothetical protein